MAALLLVGGCDPILNIQGSFFPAWIVCLAAGIVLTAVVRPAPGHGSSRISGPVLLIYPSLCLLFTLGTWLVFYRS